MGLGSYILPLTNEIKDSLKGDKKPIQTKYEQFILMQNELMAEMGHFAEKNIKDIKNGTTPATGLSKKIQDLVKKVDDQASAFKKEMFAFGNKNNCMPVFETNVQKRQANQILTIMTANQESAQAREFTMRKTNKRALKALEECQAAAPSIAGKVQKQIDDINEQLDQQEACPNYRVDAAKAF